MGLGQKLKQARLDAGLSQRQLCGTVITRNMLSQIENGSARPSMSTLSYLADRLNKPMSWFLDAGGADTDAFAEGKLLLEKAEEAVLQGKDRYAAQLLEKVREPELARRKLLTMGLLPGADLQGICRKLPSLDGELLLRARAALEQKNYERCGHLLDAVEDQDQPAWHLTLGELHLRRGEYAGAAACFQRVEDVFPEETVAKLELCYRELGDFQRAYEYACKQKK